ncbi:uncharacterized protein LOC113211521 isoform X1 [Frankliniella occidentalis]|uniref:Uncharacterized protein LOC113211521 isoform X1 n=1 Tax=Frankliniella occidentalis TaxID=133901 RepID=A0A6J1T4Z2_FRAOC|nr:uncharacterized protein LOC113211521 isoform X1 [Frankliniella occidentalis]
MKFFLQQPLDRLPRLLGYLSSKQKGYIHALPQRRHSSIIRQSSMNHEFIDVSDEVRCALLEKKPIVTLESAIITHGMPHPTNVETAFQVQNIVRQNGATPATIAIVKGRIKVGIDDETLLHLGEVKENTYKTSYRDLPFVLSQKMNGGTTVSTTLAVSNSIGVPVMVTGGIGGVHRGGETTMDVSADLIELGCTPVGVVCSGAKSILDIERTLEYLETQGVLVATFGSNKDFPAFYSRKSGFSSPYNVKTTEEAAKLLDIMRHSELRSGIVIAVPVPESNSIPSDEMEDIIKNAVQEANQKGIKGKDITPYILSHVAKSTEGRSLSTNVALIQNNAAVGAKIAVDLSELCLTRSTHNTMPRGNGPTEKKPNVVVIGGAVVDHITKLSEPYKADGRSHLAHIVQSGGGVGRNMADALGRLGAWPLLVSAVGDDLAGLYIRRDTLAHLDTSGVRVVPGGRTAVYTLLLTSEGDCHTGAGDMEILGNISTDMVQCHKTTLASSALVVLDGNVPVETINYVLQQCHASQVPVWFEPTDIHKAAKPLQTDSWMTIDFVSPNFNELSIMCKALSSDKCHFFDYLDLSDEDVVKEAQYLASLLGEHVRTVIATLGHRGIVICRREDADEPFFLISSDGHAKRLPHQSSRSLQARFYPAPVCQPVSVSGAGDCWNAGFISAALQGKTEISCVKAGFSAALCSLAATSAVPLNLEITQKQR